MRRFWIYAALIAWCMALLLVRNARSNSLSFIFLSWNLILAIVPAVAAVLFVRAKSRVAQICWFVIWILFLPNASYIVTDFIHLYPKPGVPLWYDIALLLSFAGTGLLLGYGSIADVQQNIAQRFGERTGWALAFAALLLSGFGIYLGRFARLNSWDALTDPLDLAGYFARGAMNPMAHPKTIVVTLVYGVGLMLGYLAWSAGRLARIRPASRRTNNIS